MYICVCIIYIATYMIHNASCPKLACFLYPNERMEQYMKRTKMQTLGTWATEFEILAYSKQKYTCTCMFLHFWEPPTNGLSTHL